MENTIHHEKCPACQSTSIQPVLEATDHTVSGRTFEIYHCNDCTLRFTQDAPDEISIGAYYRSGDYISHTDQSKGIVNRLYHAVRKRTLASKRKLITKAAARKTGSLLDLGAGTGAFLNEMKAHDWIVTGIEPDAGARQLAFSKYGLALKEAEELFRLPQGSFDVITMWHVLEHVHRLHPYLEQLHSLLKKDGVLIIAVPNYTSRDARAYGSYWAAYDVPRHLYHFSPASMKKLLDQHRFECVRTVPMWYDSYYVSLLSNKHRTGSNQLPRAFMRGTWSNMEAIGNPERCSSVIYIAMPR